MAVAQRQRAHSTNDIIEVEVEAYMQDRCILIEHAMQSTAASEACSASMTSSPHGGHRFRCCEY
jgi:hypothetical protein